MSGPSKSPIFRTPCSGGGVVHGVRGGYFKAHEYTDGLGIGHIKYQGKDKILTTYNSFNSSVDAMLPKWMIPK